MVTTKFSPPIVNDATKKIIPISHSVCPAPDPGMALRIADSGG